MEKILYIEGMTCQHCVMAVTEELEKIQGVNRVEVNLQKKSARITMEKDIEEKILEEAIEEAGYKLKSTENV